MKLRQKAHFGISLVCLTTHFNLTFVTLVHKKLIMGFAAFKPIEPPHGISERDFSYKSFEYYVRCRIGCVNIWSKVSFAAHIRVRYTYFTYVPLLCFHNFFSSSGAIYNVGTLSISLAMQRSTFKRCNVQSIDYQSTYSFKYQSNKLSINTGYQ